MADDAIPESRSRWDVLTTTGAGTPMGELLRRYWWPIAGASELDASPTKPVRLMGENLVLYKDLSGNYGLIDRHCKHRRADLSYGYVEKCGLRCNYHGWLYDHTGRCAEQPYEDMAHPESRFKDQVRITAYPVRELGGLLWAYLGPAPAPLVPNWEFFTWKNGFRQIVTAEIPCNWFQCQENSIDPVHFEWTHSNWSVRLKGATGPYSPQHVKVDFNEFDWGFQYKRIRTDTSAEDRLWTIGRVCLWPNALFTGNHCEFRVPIDDHNTLSITWHFSRVPRDREPYVQDKVPAWRGPIADPQTGRWVTSHVMNQDFVTWVGQGGIADRTEGDAGAERPRRGHGAAPLPRRSRGDRAGQGPQGDRARRGGQPVHHAAGGRARVLGRWLHPRAAHARPVQPALAARLYLPGRPARGGAQRLPSGDGHQRDRGRRRRSPPRPAGPGAIAELKNKA